MTLVRIDSAGAKGVNKDISQANTPINIWTDSNNVRFMNGSVNALYGYDACYNTPTDVQIIPYHLLNCLSGSQKYWLYAGLNKVYATTISGTSAVHTNLTRQTAGVDVDYSGTANGWTSTLLGGIPILNAGNLTDPPQFWNLNIANRLSALTNWPANTYCKSLRSYKNFLIALGVTKSGTSYPFMVKWSHPADPGAVPSSWDPADATKDAGEADLAEGYDIIVDGLQLRDSFIIYKQASVWRMDFVGGVYVFRFQKVLGMSGALNRNCIVEYDGFHFVLTQNDVVFHDGNQAFSVLDKQSRIFLFRDMDLDNYVKAFVVRNPIYNEVFVCYPSVGSQYCNKALVYNYKDKTTGFFDLPNVHHGACGGIDNSLLLNWAQDSLPWASDLSLWNSFDVTIPEGRVLFASNDQKLYLLDSSASFNGANRNSYVERRGIHFDKPEKRKIIKGIRPRIIGNTGETVSIKVAATNDLFDDPVFNTTMTHTIGSTLVNDCLVDGRYLTVRFESGTAYQWRLDSFDIDVDETGDW